MECSYFLHKQIYLLQIFYLNLSFPHFTWSRRIPFLQNSWSRVPRNTVTWNLANKTRGKIGKSKVNIVPHDSAFTYVHRLALSKGIYYIPSCNRQDISIPYIYIRSKPYQWTTWNYTAICTGHKDNCFPNQGSGISLDYKFGYRTCAR